MIRVLVSGGLFPHKIHTRLPLHLQYYVYYIHYSGLMHLLCTHRCLRWTLLLVMPSLKLCICKNLHQLFNNSYSRDNNYLGRGDFEKHKL